MMKLSVWAKKQGVTYRTALRWVKNNTLPENVKIKIMPTGTILVEEIKDEKA